MNAPARSPTASVLLLLALIIGARAFGVPNTETEEESRTSASGANFQQHMDGLGSRYHEADRSCAS